MKDSVKVFMVLALIFLTSIYFTMTVVHYENDIERLEKANHEQKLVIDSLNCVVDTLERRLKTFDIKYQFNQFKDEINEILDAIIIVESAGNDSAYRASEDAVGALQIRQVMVDDINRILKRKNISKFYSYDDRWCRNKSTEMFTIYCDYYDLTEAEEIARCWNGGPRGINNPYTLPYWYKVQNELEIGDSYASR